MLKRSTFFHVYGTFFSSSAIHARCAYGQLPELNSTTLDGAAKAATLVAHASAPTNHDLMMALVPPTRLADCTNSSCLIFPKLVNFPDTPEMGFFNVCFVFARPNRPVQDRNHRSKYRV